MAWNDRIKEAAYTSPSGVRTVFAYEDLSRTVDKKTTGFEFPDVDGTYVQDLGHSGRRYPLRMFFWGDDYDIEATAFENALIEQGAGKLDHPLYGTINVVPFGTITRRDDLKTAANQAVIEVTFWETINIVYPTVQTDPANSVSNAVDEYNLAAADEFEEVVKLDTVVDQATFENSFESALDITSSELQPVADTQDDVRTKFAAISDSIKTSLTILASNLSVLAAQTTQLIQTPARASSSSIETRFDTYGQLVSVIINANNGDSNKFHINDLYVSTYVTGYIISALNNQFVTKVEAIVAAETILNQFEAVTNWRDDNFKELSEIDTGSAYQQLQEAVAIAAGFLVEISFSLKQERHIILTHPRTIIDLVAELYSSVDDQLDFFISSNELSGSEILEVPRGRDIVYFV